MLNISLRNYLLIRQFVRRNRIELPSEISCSSAGGTWKKTTKRLAFAGDNDYVATINMVYIRILGRIKIPKPFEIVCFERLPWGQGLDIDPDDSSYNDLGGKKWCYKHFLGFLLLREKK